MNRIKCCFFIAAIVLFSSHTGFTKEMLTAQDRFQKGMEFEKQGVYEEAIKMYTTAVLSDDNYAEAYFRRGKAYMSSHKTFAMEALVDFNKTIDLDPTKAEAYYERGLLHAFILNNEKALNDMRTAANLGHKGAQEWLAPPTPGKSIEIAGIFRDDASPSPAAVQGEKRDKGAGRHLDLGQYLSSKSEPMIHFDFDRSTIKGQYHPLLDEIAMVLKEKIPEANIKLAGHTDSTGTEGYNNDLSLQRAKAVESYLTAKHGISPDRVTARGYGENAPNATNRTKEGQAKNRRTELRVE